MACTPPEKWAGASPVRLASQELGNVAGGFLTHLSRYTPGGHSAKGTFGVASLGSNEGSSQNRIVLRHHWQASRGNGLCSNDTWHGAKSQAAPETVSTPLVTQPGEQNFCSSEQSTIHAYRGEPRYASKKHSAR